MIKLTIIIPVYNEIKTIEKLIKKILKINIKKQLIIVDDGSSDGTEQILKKYKSKIDKLIFHKKNLDKKKLKKFNKFNVVLLPITLKDGVLDVNEAILSMAELGAQRVLVEGGAELLTQLINKKLVDILYWFRASKLIGKDGLNAVSNLSVSKMKSVKELKLISSMQIQTDTLEVYERK